MGKCQSEVDAFVADKNEWFDILVGKIRFRFQLLRCSIWNKTVESRKAYQEPSLEDKRPEYKRYH